MNVKPFNVDSVQLFVFGHTRRGNSSCRSSAKDRPLNGEGEETEGLGQEEAAHDRLKLHAAGRKVADWDVVGAGPFSVMLNELEVVGEPLRKVSILHARPREERAGQLH